MFSSDFCKIFNNISKWMLLQLTVLTKNFLYHRDFLQSVAKQQKQTPEMFYKKDVLKNFTIFTWKHFSWSFFWKKFACLKACNFIKKRLRYMCFPVNTAQFLRTPILKNTYERLLLKQLQFLQHAMLILLLTPTSPVRPHLSCLVLQDDMQHLLQHNHHQLLQPPHHL